MFFLIYVLFITLPIILFIIAMTHHKKAKAKKYVGGLPALLVVIVNAVLTCVTVYCIYCVLSDNVMQFFVLMAGLFFWYLELLLIPIPIFIFLTWPICLSTFAYVIRNSGKMLTISVDDQVCTGNGNYIENEDIIVMDGDEILKPGINYTILPESYRNNLKRGTASVNIRLYNGYMGVYKVTFRII